ncbi:hypothetical protein LARV_03668 [Longilinea arvoryzae]|uniref:Transmembrane protein n=1 Tax=Longilinea arvoryzae TaxID=360412 RepID=A0A0S7BNK0_9CHLR|nr:hypothetical protein LARV_03668 [Longilinea arvoryzae]
MPVRVRRTRRRNHKKGEFLLNVARDGTRDRIFNAPLFLVPYLTLFFIFSLFISATFLLFSVSSVPLRA